MKQTFGQEIKALRKKKNWSVYDLAGHLGRTPGYVSKIEVRGEIPSPVMILKLSEVFGVSPEGLIEVAKKEKIEEVSKVVQRRYNDAFVMYRQSKKK